MMLHRHPPHDVMLGGVRFGHPRGRVVGVQVVRDGAGPHARDVQRLLDGASHGVAGRGRLEIADVCRELRRGAVRDAHCVLEMPADGEHDARHGQRERDCLRHISTSAAHLPCAARDDSHDAVVASHRNVSIMREKEIRDVAERSNRTCRVRDNGFAAAIAARHHQRSLERGEQQMMQRRGWQHHAEHGVVGRQRCGDRGIHAPPRQDDWSRRRLERLALSGR